MHDKLPFFLNRMPLHQRGPPCDHHLVPHTHMLTLIPPKISLQDSVYHHCRRNKVLDPITTKDLEVNA